MLHSVDEANSPVAAMTHHVFEVAGPEAKKDVVHNLASGTGRRILFMRTKHQARKLAKPLTADGIPAVDLHGNLAQAARDRNLAAFAAGAAKVLVATDVAARGVHVDDVELVVHVDPPAEHKAYLHRSGRTARAGSAGDVVTVVLPEQRKDTAALLRKAAITVRPQPVTAESRAVAALVGEIAPLVVAAPPAPKQPTKPRRNAAPGTRGGDTRDGAGARSGRGPKATVSGGSDGRSTGRGGRGAKAQAGGGRADQRAGERTGRGGAGARGAGAKTGAQQAHSGGSRVNHAGGSTAAGTGAERRRGGARTGGGAAPAGSTGGVAGFSRGGGGRRRG